MMSIFKGLLALTLAVTLGLRILNPLARDQRLRSFEAVAVAYGIGLGAITWLMMVLHFSGIRFTVVNLLVPVIILCLLLSPMRTHRGTQTPFSPLSPWDWRCALLMCGIVLVMSMVFLQTILVPVESFDAVASWGLKAKAIYLARSIPRDFLLNQDYRNYAYHPDYPLLVPLAQSFTCLFIGEYNDFASKLIFPCYLFSCLVILYTACIGRFLSRTESLAFTFLLAGIPYLGLQTSIAYPDSILSFYFFAGAIYLYHWIRKPCRLYLVISAILAGLAGLTKNEGLVLSLICWAVLALYLLLHREQRGEAGWKAWLLYGIILMTIEGPWLIYRTSLQVHNDVVNQETILSSLTLENLKRVKPILYHYQSQVFGLKNWNIVWIVFLGSLLCRFRRIFQSQVKYLLALIFLAGLIYTWVYFITPRDVVWHLRTSASRIFLHFLPLVIFFLADVYAEEKKGWSSGRGVLQQDFN
jgi:hypothetical protein